MNEIKVIGRVFASFVLGAVTGIVGGEAYYQSKTDGLEPLEVRASWRDETELQIMGKKPHNIRMIYTATENFSGLGDANVSGKLRGEEVHYTVKPGQTLPEGIEFQGMPNVEFESEYYHKISGLLSTAGIFTGLAGSVGTLVYCAKKGYLNQ